MYRKLIINCVLEGYTQCWNVYYRILPETNKTNTRNKLPEKEIASSLLMQVTITGHFTMR